MRKINVAEDIVPIAELKANASNLFRRMHRNGRPLVVTQNGKATAVVLTPEEFEGLSYREYVKTKVEAGIQSVAHGETLSADEVRAHMRAKVRRMARREG